MPGTFYYNPPRHPRAPILPPMDRGVTLQKTEEQTAVSIRGGFEEEISLDPQDGAIWVRDRAMFEALSHRDDVPGALGVREVKFLVAGVDTDSPQVFFLNMATWKYHFMFAKNALGVGLSGSQFNALTYFTQNRKFLAGTIIAHDSFAWNDTKTGLYSLEFWPTDKVAAKFTILAFQLISAAMPFAQTILAYHPSGAGQEELYDKDRAIFDTSGISVVSTARIFESINYSPLNLGIGFGRLRVIDRVDPRPPGIRDVVIFKTLPNDLSHVAGVLSEDPQTPLSHVNLRAKQNDTPNAFLRNAAQDPRVTALKGQIVRFEVKPDGIDLRAATVAQMNAFLDAQRPEKVQHPPRDLSKHDIVNLNDIGHDDLQSVGAKAANLAELRRILSPEIVPEGFVVPFHFYDVFMRLNGLYERVRDIITKPGFNNDETKRAAELKSLRKKIKKAPMPTALRHALGDMHAQFAESSTPRCRSSTNNEDLVGFNGAGLYDSFTHRNDEGHIEKSIKQVWASLWNFRAFEEREFYRIDHFNTAMGVLVHPNFDGELANGVALTKNIYFPDFPGYYVNVQMGEALVTNPTDNDVSEEFLVMVDANPNNPERYEIIRMRRSNLASPGQDVLSSGQIEQLVTQMETIQAHFKTLYAAQDDSAFAMDLEFKITKDAALVIKQARPWVD